MNTKVRCASLLPTVSLSCARTSKGNQYLAGLIVATRTMNTQRGDTMAMTDSSTTAVPRWKSLFTRHLH